MQQGTVVHLAGGVNSFGVSLQRVRGWPQIIKWKYRRLSSVRLGLKICLARGCGALEDALGCRDKG